ncbi:anti-phage protein KwaB [Caldifermentibacillus hisashii]|uniref:anti-phage protein KwaB n=1 Tax=Caldifermentibacillus hisashii TaxID=996558 RepID=UPI0034157CC6
MNKEELDSNLFSFLLSKDEILGEIYFVLKHDSGTELRFVDLDKGSQIELTEQFINAIENEIINRKDLKVISISEADDRTNAIYEYDLEETPHELDVIDKVIQNENITSFSFKSDSLKDIQGIIILFSNRKDNLVFYKKHYPFNLYNKDKFSIRRMGNDSRFTKLEEDIVKINATFEFFKFKNTLFINNIKTLEKFFGFHDIIKKNAVICIKKITELGILENPEELLNMTDDITFARKLTKIKTSSPVLKNVPNKAIITFAKTYPILTGKFKFNEDDTKIVLSSKQSKNLFIKLLNDDFLHSELTTLYYESVAKDNLVPS